MDNCHKDRSILTTLKIETTKSVGRLEGPNASASIVKVIHLKPSGDMTVRKYYKEVSAAGAELHDVTLEQALNRGATSKDIF